MDASTSPLPNHAASHGKIVVSPFRPHPLLRGAHLQTIVSSVFRPMPRVELRRERIELDDGDFVDLGWSGKGDGPIVIMLHGLGGGFDSKYALGLTQRLNARGWRSVILQLRGAGPEPNRLARTYHHGDTADFRHVCNLLRAREPETPLLGAGWSLGANVMLKALAEESDDSPLCAAATSSPPFVLEPCVEHLRHGFARVYQRHLLQAVKDGVRRKHGPIALPAGADLVAALQARDFYEFDDAYTAPVNGFRDARDYYARAACGQYLHAIRRPTLTVHALDDPFMVPAIVPSAQMLAPPVTLELCRHGGHVGFLSARSDGTSAWWLEQRFEHYLVNALSEFERGQSSNCDGNHMASP